MTLQILAGPEFLSTDWLTAALRHGGVINDASVNAFQAESLGEGVGILGRLVRLSLDYDRPEPGAPATLIAKFPSPAQENRQVGVDMGHYAAELDFYQHLADRVSLRVPAPYYADLERETGEFVLLIEDLAPAEPGDQVAGSTVEQTTTAVLELARFHAEWWGKVDTPELAWMRAFDSPALTAAVDTATREAWPACVARFGDSIPTKVQEVGERLSVRTPILMAEIAKPPRGIVHGDFRVDNLMYGQIRGGAPLAVLDWQISGKGRSTYDIGYHMSQSVPPDLRSTIEENLLRDYHRVLLEGGVRDYSFDACWRDYRYAVLFCLVYPTIVCGSLDTGNDRGAALGAAMLERSVRGISELQAGALLPD